MKKYFVVAVLVTLVSPFVAVAATFNVNLQYKITGSDVSTLQQFLTNQGLYNGPVTGTFGPLTKQAVIAFQKAQGITPATGFFGALTRAQANKILVTNLASSTQKNTAPVVVNPNESLMIPQGGVVGTPISQTPNTENFTLNGNTYNYENLPMGMSIMSQGPEWTQVPTQYGTVWVYNQDYPLPASNICNDTYYQSCPTGENLVCSGTGFYCESPVQQVAQSQTATQAVAQSQQQTVLNSLNNKISDLQKQSSSCIAAMTSGSVIALGTAGVASEAKAAQCQNISSELTAFLDEKGIVQGGGVMTQICSDNISTLEQQIYTLRQTALGQEAGYLTGGSSSVGAGNAERIAQAETQQEAPLVQQVEQNIYYCKN